MKGDKIKEHTMYYDFLFVFGIGHVLAVQLLCQIGHVIQN